MTFPLIRSLLTTLSLALAVTSLDAQTPTPAAEPEPTITVKFRVITWQAGQPAAFNYSTNGISVIVEKLHNSLRSPFYDYTGPATLLLYPPVKTTSAATKAASSATPPPPVPPIAAITIPTNVRYPLLVLVPTPSGPFLYRALVFDDDPASFPFGAYLFQNFSNRKVATDMSGNRFVLDPAGTHLVTSEQKALHLRMAVSEETADGGWRIIYDNFYPNWIERRTVIFLVDTIREGKVHLELRTLLENQAVWNAANPPAAKPAVVEPAS
jgi:hypothetical protein